MKKILLTLGTTIAIASPLSTTIACSKSDSTPVLKDEGHYPGENTAFNYLDIENNDSRVTISEIRKTLNLYKKLYIYAQNKSTPPLQKPYTLFNDATDADIQKIIDEIKLYVNTNNTFHVVEEQDIKDGIVIWYRGNSEYGSVILPSSNLPGDVGAAVKSIEYNDEESDHSNGRIEIGDTMVIDIELKDRYEFPDKSTTTKYTVEALAQTGSDEYSGLTIVDKMHFYIETISENILDSTGAGYNKITTEKYLDALNALAEQWLYKSATTIDVNVKLKYTDSESVDTGGRTSEINIKNLGLKKDENGNTLGANFIEYLNSAKQSDVDLENNKLANSAVTKQYTKHTFALHHFFRFHVPEYNHNIAEAIKALGIPVTDKNTWTQNNGEYIANNLIDAKSIFGFTDADVQLLIDFVNSNNFNQWSIRGYDDNTIIITVNNASTNTTRKVALYK